MTRTQRYREGDWFVVPLFGGGFAVGVVARANPKGVLLGYFFGPRRDQPPRLEDVTGLTPASACLVAHFGHLGLKGGQWQVLGRLPDWDRSEWPMPVFHRYEELTGRYIAVHYDPDDPNARVREVQITAVEADRLPQAGLAGAGYIERKLPIVLGASSRPRPS